MQKAISLFKQKPSKHYRSREQQERTSLSCDDLLDSYHYHHYEDVPPLGTTSLSCENLLENKQDHYFSEEEEMEAPIPPPTKAKTLRLSKSTEILNRDNILENTEMVSIEEGYSCTLVSLSKHSFMLCSFCNKLQRRPSQTTCCGRGYCKACLEALLRARKPCPHCDAKSYHIYPNHKLQEKMKHIEVYCSYRTDGCSWSGKFQDFERHLSCSDDGSGNTRGCAGAKSKCPYCNIIISKGKLERHTKNVCVKRPFVCQFCAEYKSTFEDVVSTHRPACAFYPAPCPNDCGEMIMNVDMQSHIKNDCPLRELECEFASAGCTIKLKRKDMPGHMHKGQSMHLSMLMKSFAEAAEKSKVWQEETKKELSALREENRLLWKMVERSRAPKQDKTAIIIQQPQPQQESIQLPRKGSGSSPDPSHKTLATEMEEKEEREVIQSAEFAMHSYSKFKRENNAWLSPPFYIQQKGYRMCLQVYGNGFGQVRGQYVSLYIYILHGEFDDTLPWPFRGNVTVELVSRNSSDKNYRADLSFTEGSPIFRDREQFGKEANVKDGRGLLDFIHLSRLPSIFLKDDSLLFRVLRYV